MSSFFEAILTEIAEASADDRRRLAELLAPHLASNAATSDSDRWLRGADQIAAHIGAPRSRVYALTSSGRLPVHHDGSALIARRSELDDWVRAGGAKRP